MSMRIVKDRMLSQRSWRLARKFDASKDGGSAAEQLVSMRF